MRRDRPPAHGVSLIEALVALLVMAFGMLAVVGVQGSLRVNADVSRQRYEAVHIAQIEIEKWRGYTSLDAAEGQTAYASLTSTDQAVTIDSTVYGNAIYSLRRTVTAGTNMKTLLVEVTWVDRSGTTQSVHFDTVITAVVPGIGGTLSVPAFGTPTRQPLDRNIGIPIGAQPIDGNRSVFRPTSGGSAALAWVFDNVTGFIVSQCRAADTSLMATITSRDLSQCLTVKFLPLSGYVRFGENMAGPAMNMRMDIQGATATCLDDSPKSSSTSPNPYVTYVCAITTTMNANLVDVWSGRPHVTLCAAALADCPARDSGKLTVDSVTYLECRFQPHPSDGYVAVSIPLANQNLAVALACPAGSDSN
jgi:Tfp pilus assembly protein PilV